MDIFEMIGPVMIGPSSSHTAGAARIGLMARTLLGEQVAQAQIGLHGSFAKTYNGHGTDRALTAGLLGMEPADERIREALDLAKQAGMQVSFSPIQLRGVHPNTVQLDLTGVEGTRLQMQAASIGGGAIEVTRINGFTLSFSGDSDMLIIHHRDEPGRIAAVTMLLSIRNVNIASMQVYRSEAGADAIMVIELDSEPDGRILEDIRLLPGINSVRFVKGI